MIVTCNSIGEVQQVCSFFSIPINTAEIEISFPYPFPLKTLNGAEVEDYSEYTFEQFQEKYLPQRT